MNISEFALF